MDYTSNYSQTLRQPFKTTLNSKNCNSQTVKNTHDALNALAEQAKLVRLTWIKAHIGLDRNKLADKYAKLDTVDDSTPIKTQTFKEI